MRPTPLTEARRELAEAYVPLARKLARPLKAMYPHWRDEFESAACLALVGAARSFDPSRGLRFATYARFRVRDALMGVGRSMGLPGPGDAPGTVSLTPYNQEHGRVLVSSAPPAVGAEHDDVDAVEGWLRRLPRDLAHVCRRYYLHGETLAEIAEGLGVSPGEAGRRHELALELLRPAYHRPAGRTLRRHTRTPP